MTKTSITTQPSKPSANNHQPTPTSNQHQPATNLLITPTHEIIKKDDSFFSGNRNEKNRQSFPGQTQREKAIQNKELHKTDNLLDEIGSIKLMKRFSKQQKLIKGNNFLQNFQQIMQKILIALS